MNSIFTTCAKRVALCRTYLSLGNICKRQKQSKNGCDDAKAGESWCGSKRGGKVCRKEMKVARVTTSDCDRVRKSSGGVGGVGGFNVKVG